VEQAINACKPEARSLLQNRQHMEMVKEALNEGYCDISGAAVDLALIGALPWHDYLRLLSNLTRTRESC